MKIKKYNSFLESDTRYGKSELEKFPSLDEVRGYFYDFTDEANSIISDYSVGYKYFETALHFKSIATGNPITSEKFVDILNTDLSNGRLDLMSDFIIVNKTIPEDKKDLLKKIINKEIPAYDYMNIVFKGSLFKEELLDTLIHCLKVFYFETDFRPYGCLWTEDYVDTDTEVLIKHLGFEGTFFRGSDQEYLKISQIFNQGSRSKDLVEHFIK